MDISFTDRLPSRLWVTRDDSLGKRGGSVEGVEAYLNIRIRCAMLRVGAKRERICSRISMGKLGKERSSVDGDAAWTGDEV
jgi:hypothetical protein